MKAIATTDFGAPATLVEIPAPEPAEGEILVRVASSSINGFDLSVASGRLKGVMEPRFPVGLGKDFAGTIETVGPGVDGVAEGDTVFGVVMKPELGDGCFGERVATPAAFAAKAPHGARRPRPRHPQPPRRDPVRPRPRRRRRPRLPRRRRRCREGEAPARR